MRTYETLVEGINDLISRGYTLDFSMTNNCIECKSEGTIYYPGNFEIVEFYRFEGMSNPDDSSILYAIDAGNGLKGTLVDAYGMYSDALSFEMMQKLKFEPK
jgi:hypothetical protein